MKIVFHFDGSPALRKELSGLGVQMCPENDEQQFARLLPGTDVLWHVLKPVTAQVIAAAPQLRLIQKIGTGVNTIDLEAARRRGIAVCNLPGTNTRAVAEMTLLLMLSCLRRVTELDTYVRKAGGWAGSWALQDQLGELGGRTVGLVGFGAVPQLLKPVLEALGARVLYWSRSARNAELPELLSTCDVVSLHLPLTDQTAGLLDPRALKRGAILVNTARGGLVQEQHLESCLESGHVGAAGLDVFAEEPVPPAHPLLRFRNVVAAPHVAWLTRETLQRSVQHAMENVQRLRDGRALNNRVV